MSELVRPTVECPECHGHYAMVEEPELLPMNGQERNSSELFVCSVQLGGCGHKFRRTDRERQLYAELDTVARKLPVSDGRRKVINAISEAWDGIR